MISRTVFVGFAILSAHMLMAQGYPPIQTPGTGGNGPGYAEPNCVIYGDESTNGLDHIDVWFSDPDGDCKTDQWEAIYYYNDGRDPLFRDSYNENCKRDPSIPCFTTIDFGSWGCCALVNNGGGSYRFGDTCLLDPNCSDCNNLEEWLTCGLFTCSRC